MTEPTPIDAPLTAEQIDGRMRSALAAISAGWDDMLTHPPAARVGQRTTGTGAILADDSHSDDDTPRLLRVIEDRAQVTASLNGWCRVVIEDHDVEHGIPDGTDVPKMCEFLTRWTYLMAEHAAALDLLEELRSARSLVAKWCPPTQHRPHGWHPRPRSMRLGACPLTWQDPATAQDRPCPGVLRGDEDGWVTCDACGTRAVMGWWEQRLHGEDGLAPMTLEEVRVYLHRMHGMRLTLRTLRSWVQAGDLVAFSTGEGVASRFDAGAVEAALTRRGRRASHG